MINLDVFKKVMGVHRLLGLPAMTVRERGVYKQILLSLSKRGRVDIFEYGSGFSTVYFAKFLKARNIPFHIDSIDNHAGWNTEVGRMIEAAGLKDDVTLQLTPFSPFWDKPGWDWGKVPVKGVFAPASKEELAYVEAPLRLKKKFDLIVVDGRFRRRCLEIARDCLKEGGVLFLHDAQNEKYHAPLPSYAHGRFIDGGKYYPLERRTHQIWVGGMDLKTGGRQ